jgi:methionyl-tRNA formyltransferase
MKICVITDNLFLYNEFKRIICSYDKSYKFDFFYSEINKRYTENQKDNMHFKPINLKKQTEEFFDSYDLFLSLHCKQLFPDELVLNHRCINIHPGLNPYNRGWFPQAFSIINHKPVGVTIHEMDTELDHGNIIFQEEIPIFEYETSYDVYKKIQALEIKMIEDHLEDILNKNYSVYKPLEEGNINLKSDFKELCKIELDKRGTYRELIELLRATTFFPYDNAYFYDKNGEKIYISINLKKDSKEDMNYE